MALKITVNFAIGQNFFIKHSKTRSKYLLEAKKDLQGNWPKRSII